MVSDSSVAPWSASASATCGCCSSCVANPAFGLSAGFGLVLPLKLVGALGGGAGRAGKCELLDAWLLDAAHERAAGAHVGRPVAVAVDTAQRRDRAGRACHSLLVALAEEHPRHRLAVRVGLLHRQPDLVHAR